MDVATKKEGPCIILAGAGTGKTHTIVEKVKYLVNNKIYSPERIVCITFSNEAANNLATRIRKIIGVDGKEPIIETFHSFSASLLRKYGSLLNISPSFNILEPDEAKVVLHRHFKIQPMACHRYVNSIGVAKDLGIEIGNFLTYLDNFKGVDKSAEPEKVLESLNFELNTLHLKDDREKKRKLVEEIKNYRSYLDLKKFVSAWSAYEKIKAKKGYQDYSDLNRNALELLRKSPAISNDFDYIVVDEFQDTNKVQLDFLFHLAPHGNITIVGDLNQSIYRFRGAYRENFTLFKNHFHIEDNDVFNLDKSYRSSNKILRAAHKLILNNYENKDECFEVKNISNREGNKLELYELKNGREEARKVVELVKREIDEGTDMNEICVMFRTHQQGRIIKNYLEEAAIKCCSVTKSSLLKNKLVKTARDYLTILEKLSLKKRGGEQAWWDLIYQMDFSDKDLVIIGRCIKDNRESENLSAKLLNCLETLPLSQTGKLSMRILIEKIKRLLPSAGKEVSLLLPEVYQVAGLVSPEEEKSKKGIFVNLDKFYELAKTHSTLYSDDLESFLTYLDILDNLEIDIKATDSEDFGVRLMTLHSTKGLEYKTVIVTNMAQKRFPIESIAKRHLVPAELYPDLTHLKNVSVDDKEEYIENYERKNQLLEERRLCYVAFTRAKEKLILTYSNEYSKKKHFPSQFLNEIDYKKNPDFEFFMDENENTYEEPPAKYLPKFSFVVQSDNFDQAMLTMITNTSREKLTLSGDNIVLSPSSLLLFNECQKKYEYRYVYNMPEQKTLSWEALKLGSFVHEILERGVKDKFKSVNDFISLAKEMQALEEWSSVNVDEALALIRVFFERNRGKYNEKSKTEQPLKTKIGNISFMGFADRIDFTSEGLEIIDYKTGATAVAPLHRNWQLGYYAIAARPLGKVKKVCLEMLKHEKPIEYTIDEKGDAYSASGRFEFNVNEIENELIETSKQIVGSYKNGFKACSVDKNCEFCNEYVYGF